MTTTATRQPKGIPVGGQFAATTHAEPAATLPAPVQTATVHERVHADLLGDRLNPQEEARAAREAIDEALDTGDLGADGAQVCDLSHDDRLVRLAVDRYVVTGRDHLGELPPEKTGYRLGRLLLELHGEDLADAMNSQEGELA
ncbi:hypothetical protein ACQCSX_22155 (plasmid) [Pseudarthrobacter sp. P1]|uniref:hypothetical protein n=1 Tax=Pseudarthrobacter sp. P1 TaxID=3418418 RepID=UPI003CECE25E